MTSKEEFDFWYAVNRTEILKMPERRLETFGTTVLNYHLVTELMDSVNRVRIREGRIEAARPEIVTPQSFAESLLEGFGSEAGDYADWLRAHEQHLYILKYGFKIRKQERNEYILSDPVEAVVERIKQDLDQRNDPLGALALGVDKPWEVCLLKLMVEVTENSVSGNVSDLEQKDLFTKARKDPTGMHRRIEAAFLAATKDASRIGDLAALLEKANVFKEYEDRFFALVHSHRRR